MTGKRFLLRAVALAALAALVVAAAAAARTGRADGPAARQATPVKVALVTDIGGLNDRGFNHLSYLGLLKAQSELGISQRVYQAKSTQDYVPNLSTALAKCG